MTRMRYGPRFGQQIVGANAPYNAAMDKMAKRVCIMAAKINKNRPQYKRELCLENHRKKVIARVSALGEERRSAEARMCEAVRTATRILEHNMIDLMNHRALGGKWGSRLNQKKIFNVIVELKTKCGVDFGNGINAETVKRVPLAPEARDELMERQKADRLSSMERVKKRLLDRK